MAIGDPIDDRSAKSGNHADDHADHGTSDRQPYVLPPIFDAGHPARTQRGILGDRAILTQQGNDLGDGEYAQSDDHQLQPVGEIGNVISRHAQAAACVRFADRADQQSQARRRDAFQGQTSGKDRDHRQAEDGDHQHFWQTERQHDRPRDQDKKCKDGCAEQPTKQRRDEGGGKRPRGFALLGQRKAVKDRGL